MRHFERRLRKLETIEARKRQHFVWVGAGQTIDEAKAAFMALHPRTQDHDSFVFVRWQESESQASLLEGV